MSRGASRQRLKKTEVTVSDFETAREAPRIMWYAQYNTYSFDKGHKTKEIRRSVRNAPKSQKKTDQERKKIEKYLHIPF